LPTPLATASVRDIGPLRQRIVLVVSVIADAPTALTGPRGRILSSMADAYQTASPSIRNRRGRLWRMKPPSASGSRSPQPGGMEIARGPMRTTRQ
jgi:hypothetical protein